MKNWFDIRDILNYNEAEFVQKKEQQTYGCFSRQYGYLGVIR